jgi:hypothetical protein
MRPRDARRLDTTRPARPRPCSERYDPPPFVRRASHPSDRPDHRHLARLAPARRPAERLPAPLAGSRRTAEPPLLNLDTPIQAPALPSSNLANPGRPPEPFRRISPTQVGHPNPFPANLANPGRPPETLPANLANPVRPPEPFRRISRAQVGRPNPSGESREPRSAAPSILSSASVRRPAALLEASSFADLPCLDPSPQRRPRRLARAAWPTLS